MKDKNLHIIQEVVANTGRFILAASFIFSGFVKAVDPLGFQYKIQDYLAAFGMASWFPSFFPLLGGIVLSSVEFFIGCRRILYWYLFVFRNAKDDRFFIGVNADDFYDATDTVPCPL